jgi:hypothetical protein
MTIIDSIWNTLERTRLRHSCNLVLTKHKVGENGSWIAIAVMARQGERSTQFQPLFCSQFRPVLATRTSFDILDQCS